MNRYYVVLWSIGEYSDARYGPVAVFHDEAAAEKFVEQATQEEDRILKELHDSIGTTSERGLRNWPFTPEGAHRPALSTNKYMSRFDLEPVVRERGVISFYSVVVPVPLLVGTLDFADQMRVFDDYLMQHMPQYVAEGPRSRKLV